MPRLLLLQAVIIYVWFLFPPHANANKKFWFENRVEIGYDKMFIRESFTIRESRVTRNRVSVGFNFRLSQKISYRTFYLLNNSLRNDWQTDHQFGAQLSFKLE